MNKALPGTTTEQALRDQLPDASALAAAVGAGFVSILSGTISTANLPVGAKLRAFASMEVDAGSRNVMALYPMLQNKGAPTVTQADGYNG